MENTKSEISQCNKFIAEYETLLQKVKHQFEVRDHKFIDISKSKASRVLNRKQFDILTLIKMADCVNIDVELFFKERKIIK